MVSHSKIVCIVALLCPGFCLAVGPKKPTPLTELKANVSDVSQSAAGVVLYDSGLSIDEMNAKILDSRRRGTTTLTVDFDLRGVRIKDWIDSEVAISGSGGSTVGTVVAAFLSPESARCTMQIRLSRNSQQPALGEARIRLNR